MVQLHNGFICWGGKTTEESAMWKPCCLCAVLADMAAVGKLRKPIPMLKTSTHMCCIHLAKFLNGIIGIFINFHKEKTSISIISEFLLNFSCSF